MQLHSQTIKDRDTWNSTLALLPGAHVLQTWEWGDFKAKTTGWSPQRIAYMHKNEAVAMAQILTRQEGPFKIMYVPKGPALDWSNQPLRQAVISTLKRYAHDRGAIFIKIDPDIVTEVGEPGAEDEQINPLGHAIREEWQAEGLRFSDEQIQFRNSVIIDLRHDEDDLLMNMKSKTRYNVRLSGRRDVEVRMGGPEDMDLEDFMRAGLAQPFIAEWKGMPLAHVIIFGFGKRAWYFYGASSSEERNRMPTYALQWEAVRWAKRQGMQVYDMWGAPDDFTDEDDPLAGVYRFKSGFGGKAVRRIGAWDYPARERLYHLYRRAMPAVLSVMRKIGEMRLRTQSNA